MLSGIFDLRCRACSYTAKGLKERDANAAVRTHREQHGGSISHVPDRTERLPHNPIVGDRVRIKGPAKPGDKDPRDEFEKLYGERAWEDHVVEKAFSPRLYGEAMFQLAAPNDLPRILVRPNQLEFAWRNENERRAGLAAAMERAA